MLAQSIWYGCACGISGLFMQAGFAMVEAVLPVPKMLVNIVDEKSYGFRFRKSRVFYIGFG
jgi:hypothetical protein